MLSSAEDKNKSHMNITSPTQSSEPTRNQATAASAAIAAALDSIRAHQTLFPGLATLFFDGSNSSKYSSLTDYIDDASNFLPTVEAVSNAALKSIDDFPPYVTMNIRDSAPQLTLEDVTPDTNNEREDAADGVDFSKTIRRFVVRGKMRGYRMARASHGVSHGCYYYEAIILGSKSGVGMKRPREEGDGNAYENARPIEESAQDSGHLRIGWSTMLGDLQAPVGYDKYSYGVRDIMGSRIHNKRREDKWGGQGFGPGDVIGFLICLNEKTIDGAENAAAAATTAQTNYIQVYKNGVSMGDEQKSTQRVFENVASDTYFPAVSCYLNGQVHMNFGPNFVYSPAKLSNGETPKPVCELCASPPSPEEAEETIVSSSKEGRKIFLSKRTDESIVTAFKQLVRTEATVRRDAYARHLLLQKIDILALRNERGLYTLDLFGING